jgi:hypothetical protein
MKLYMIKESALHWLWDKVPKSWLYWAVIHAWAKASVREYPHLHPDEITWSMTCKYLEKND